MKIILFRHGDKQNNITTNQEIPLSLLGIDQITKLSYALKNRFPKLNNSKYLFSSPYKRTIQSAKIIQSILNFKKILIIPEFQEFCPVENFFEDKNSNGHLLAEAAMINPDWIIPGSNISYNMAVSNFESKIREICLKHSQEFFLISSHGGIIRNFVYSINPKFRPNDEKIFESKIHQGGYTVLSFDGKNFKVEEFDVYNY